MDNQEIRGKTALIWAAQKGHEKVVEMLLQQGADVDKQKSSGETALIQAAQNGHETVVEILRAAGSKG